MIAAIDVGSNALRMAIASVTEGQPPTVTENAREPVRLGEDVFSKGSLSEETIRRVVKAFERFREIMDKARVQRWRAVGTSAMREARNRAELMDRIAQTSGIQLTVIGGEEEAHLVCLAVASRVNLKGKKALLVDIGGGSVEVTVAHGSKIMVTESFRMGAVRLLKEFDEPELGDKAFNQLVREHVDATRRRIRKELGDERIELCVATGGNVESLGDLRKTRFGGDNTSITAAQLDELTREILGMSIEERVKKLDLRPDRADVIVPAAIVLQKIMRQAGMTEVQIPHIGLREGLLLDLSKEMRHEKSGDLRDQVIASAVQLGKKYAFDEQHGVTVARFATQLFDDLRKKHDMDDKHRLLLEVASLLHDIGNCVSIAEHHKHSGYLLLNSPLVGLTESQRAIVANVARYHRKSAPSQRHEAFRSLSGKEQAAVTKLAAILRIADALDKEHDDQVKAFKVDLENSTLTLRLKGDGDLLMERWAVPRKADLFEEVFGMKVKIAD